jgi:cation transporter-like permease
LSEQFPSLPLRNTTRHLEQRLTCRRPIMTYVQTSRCDRQLLWDDDAIHNVLLIVVRMLLRQVLVFVLIVISSSSSNSSSTTTCQATTFTNTAFPRVFASIMAPASSNSSTNESAVLSELKETIRKQAQEIEKLRRNQLPAKAATSSGHGPPVAHDSSYLEKSFLQIAHQRVGWLSLFLVSLSFTALIVNSFEHTLSRQIELAFFMPLLAGHGGNTGGQTVGTILSALSSQSITLQDAPKVIMKEASSGLTVGIFLGTLLALVSHYGMGISAHVSTCLCCTLPLVSLIAATLGATIPFLCVALNLEPSVIAAPAMTSFVDVTGLLAYFLIANQVFHFFGLEL